MEAVATDVRPVETVTPVALVVATEVVTEGAPWEVPVAEPAPAPAVVTAAVPAVVAGIACASAPVVAPTPTTSAASDQFDMRRTRLRPLSRTDSAVLLSGPPPDPERRLRP
jgi:hypothetical protein